MIQTREKKIMDGLIVLCIAAGFACFALIVLPQQLSRAGAIARLGHSRANISSLVELGDTAVQRPMERAEGIVARFVPEPAPVDTLPPGGAGLPPPSGEEEFAAAGGAGIAIDDGGEEAGLSYDAAHSAEAISDANYESDLAIGDPYGEAAYGGPPAALPASAEPPKTVVHPQSSIVVGEPSSSDGAPARRKNAWLATPEGFEADVAFWRDIYTRYDKNFVVLHHPRYLDVVYGVVDLRDIESNPRINDIERERMRENRVEARRDEVTDALMRISENPDPSVLTAGDRAIYDAMARVTEPDKWKRAAREDGVRAQLGQADKFIAGLKYSNRYMGEIERIFAAYGLPRELTRLIFVESMFNPRAISSAGASGIWQFMRGTGRLYLRLNDIYDERNDPISSSHAAAKLLSHNYQELGTWPLAINAYNAGRGRLKQAVAQTGTRDIGRIIRNFSHPSYGFASRNFFLEFLAACEIAENHEKYFGRIDFDDPLRFEEVRLDYHVSLPQIAELARIPPDALAELNPSFSAKAAQGAKLIPAGTRIRVPEGKGELVIALASRAPKSRKGPVHHVVQKGETINSIAALYGVTPAEIMKQNGISRTLHRGQTIKIPAR